MFTGAQAASQEAKGTADREYHFQTTMQGFTGIGGEIDGLRNLVLAARKGERVRLNIVNGELMVHDVALEWHGVASEQVLHEGATAFVDFVAERDTYFCTIPGHRISMSGPFSYPRRGYRCGRASGGGWPGPESRF